MRSISSAARHACQSVAPTSPIGPCTAALLTRTCTDALASSQSWTTASMAALSDTSTACCEIVCVSDDRAAATRAAASTSAARSRPTSQRSAPSRANASAVARPSPRDAPVMSAERSVRRAAFTMALVSPRGARSPSIVHRRRAL